MHLRPTRAALLALTLAACSANPSASTPVGGSTSAPGGSATPSAAAGTASTIDLSGVTACALVPAATVEALTGETGFTSQQKADVRSASCFWAVPKPGVPQYLEVKIDRRTAPLGDYALNVNGIPCPGAAVPGIGTEARGGVCISPQAKVWLIAMDKGVSVQVIVNEPKGTLTPDGLADVAKAILASLG